MRKLPLPPAVKSLRCFNPNRRANGPWVSSRCWIWAYGTVVVDRLNQPERYVMSRSRTAYPRLGKPEPFLRQPERPQNALQCERNPPSAVLHAVKFLTFRKREGQDERRQDHQGQPALDDRPHHQPKGTVTNRDAGEPQPFEAGNSFKSSAALSGTSMDPRSASIELHQHALRALFRDGHEDILPRSQCRPCDPPGDTPRSAPLRDRPCPARRGRRECPYRTTGIHAQTGLGDVKPHAGFPAFKTGGHMATRPPSGRSSSNSPAASPWCWR